MDAPWEQQPLPVSLERYVKISSVVVVVDLLAARV